MKWKVERKIGEVTKKAEEIFGGTITPTQHKQIFRILSFISQPLPNLLRVNIIRDGSLRGVGRVAVSQGDEVEWPIPEKVYINIRGEGNLKFFHFPDPIDKRITVYCNLFENRDYINSRYLYSVVRLEGESIPHIIRDENNDKGISSIVI